MGSLIKVLPIILVFWVSLNSAIPQVHVTDGIIEGIIQRTRKGRIFSAFLGIPYAQPPVGKLRFRSPIPVEAWKFVRKADKDANVCPQASALTVVIGSEDCLYLNVYTPRIEFYSTMSLLPVMVWIHGGAFNKGNSSSTTFSANSLLDKDIILVTLNYRLGVLGFFSTGDSQAPGNFGLKDQVLALKWVQKNIRAFGGDPNRVTIFGQSAGGVSVGLHALSDASNGLFQQYIIQSGSPLAPWGFRNRSEYELYSKEFALLHFCPITNTKILVDCLRTKNLNDLLDLRSAILYAIKKFPFLEWTPTNEPESEDAFLTDSPENLIARNKMKDQPFMSGNVGNEGKLLSEVLYTNEHLYYFLRLNIRSIVSTMLAYFYKPQYARNFKEEVINYYFNGSVLDIQEKVNKTSIHVAELSKFVVRRMTEFLTGYYFQPRIFNKFMEDILNLYENERRIDLYSNEKFIQGISTFFNDASFLYPQLKLLENRAKASRNPFYFYLFNYQGAIVPSSNNKTIEKFTGVGHSAELFYLFPPEIERVKSIGADEFIIDFMIDMWTSFVINGKPTSNFLYYPDIWRPYVENKSYLKIEGDSYNVKITSEHDFIADRFNFWDRKTLAFYK